MYQLVMIENVTVLPWQTFRYLNISEIKSDAEERKRKDFDVKIQSKLWNYFYPPKDPIKEQEIYADETKVEELTMPEVGNFEFYYEYISSEMLILEDVENMRLYKVISCTKVDMGHIIGVNNYNPIIDTRVYEVILHMDPCISVQLMLFMRTCTFRLTMNNTSIS